jgi:hypothetical protein
MATKQLYATKDFRYRTRMMRSGDPVEMTGPEQRLYRALGAVSYEKPKKAAPTCRRGRRSRAPTPRKAPAKKPAAKRTRKPKP